MKKLLIIGLCALTGAGAMAQTDIVKEAERAMKKNATFTEVVNIITPAMSNSETAQQAATYYIPGKAGFNQYDELFKMKTLNRLPDGGVDKMGEALLGGYTYFMKALPLDSLPNEKGQVKPKYSKDIINVLAGHVTDYEKVAIDQFNLGNFGNAYELFKISIDLTKSPLMADKMPIPADSILAITINNMGLAAYNNNDKEGAFQAWVDAKNHGLKSKNLYTNIISLGTMLQKDDTVLETANEAIQLFGEDLSFLQILINNKIKEKEYTEAVNLIDHAIAQNPENASFYVIKGILLEQDEIQGDAKGAYAKAVELDPYNAQAQYNYGRMFYNEAMVINDAAPADDAVYSKIYYEQVKPLLLKSVEILENAANLKEDYDEPLKILQQAYYLLQDEEGLKSVESRLGN